MKWTLEAADLKTGNEMTFSVEAANEIEARRKAASMGLAVSACTPEPAEVIEYRSKAKNEPPPGPFDTAKSERYRDIVDAAGSVGGLAGAFKMIGIIGMVLGVIALAAGVLALLNSPRNAETQSTVTACIGAGVGLMMWSILPLGAAALMRLASGTALAVRDMALKA